MATCHVFLTCYNASFTSPVLKEDTNNKHSIFHTSPRVIMRKRGRKDA